MFCFSAPAFTCLLTPSHTGQALEHEPCRSLSRSIRRSQTWFDWPATSQWLKNKGDACATCSFGLPCYWLLHLQEIASVSFLQWSVPLPFVPRPLVSCQLTLCPLLPARFILSILPFHFPSSGRVQTNSVWMFCRLELISDLISVKNLNSIDICQRLHLYFVGAPKLQNSMENTLGHKHPRLLWEKTHLRCFSYISTFIGKSLLSDSQNAHSQHTEPCLVLPFTCVAWKESWNIADLGNIRLLVNTNIGILRLLHNQHLKVITCPLVDTRCKATRRAGTRMQRSFKHMTKNLKWGNWNHLSRKFASNAPLQKHHEPRHTGNCGLNSKNFEMKTLFHWH